MVRSIRPLFAVVLACAAYFSVVQIGTADTNGPFWSCRGSVGYLGSTDQTQPGRIEPVTANAGDPKQPNPCANDDAGANQTIASQQGSITAQAIYAATRIKPVLGASSQQVASGVGQVNAVHIESADGSFKLNADVATA